MTALEALWRAFIANLVAPLDEADRLTAEALEMLEEEDGRTD